MPTPMYNKADDHRRNGGVRQSSNISSGYQNNQQMNTQQQPFATTRPATFEQERREYNRLETIAATTSSSISSTNNNNNSAINVRNAVLNSDRYSHSHPSSLSSQYNNNSMINNDPQSLPSNTNQTNTEHKRKRVRHALLIATLSFLGMLVLDGLIQFTDLSSKVESSVDLVTTKVKTELKEGAVELKVGVEEFERRLVDGNNGVGDISGGEAGGSERRGGLLRRLMNSLLDNDPSSSATNTNNNNNVERTLLNEQLITPDERSHTVGLDPYEATGNDKYIDQSNKNNTMLTDQTTTNGRKLNDGNKKRRRKLHTFPLIPHHALQHRMRRELIEMELPIPKHLQEGVIKQGAGEEDGKKAGGSRRRRMYPMLISDVGHENVMHGGGRGLVETAQEDEEEEEATAATQAADNINYETGELYQGYGTHYMDLWVGTPPQRQTVIIDTGSSITAFPCSGCVHCGDNPATGEQYHTDVEFNVEDSSTYQVQECKAGSTRGGNDSISCELGSCTISAGSNNERQCKLSVSYAEGSSWAAIESNDIVYPAGPHDMALVSKEERVAAGIGEGMGSYVETDKEDDENDFDWMDFRLKFGCQEKVTGLFRSQLEDGIVGMDNRKGAFLRQLDEHYKKNGFVTPREDDEDDSFDPSQFSLCYSRKPLSDDLKEGVGSGSFTLGGSDELMHKTDMVYAANLSPMGGWYPVRIKAMFIKTKGGTLAEPVTGRAARSVKFLRVNADESKLNGSPSPTHGVILDSGTTDTYLSSALKGPFQEAWKEAVGDYGQAYDNNARPRTAEEVKSLPTILIVLQGHELGNLHNSDAPGMTKSHPEMFVTDKRRSLFTLEASGSKTGGGTTSDEALPAISKTDVVIAVSPEHYMEESSSEPGIYTARIYFSEQYGAQSIMGSNVMMGHNLLFDNSHGRIGIAESDCDHDKYIEERDRQQSQGEEEEVAVVEDQVAEEEDPTDEKTTNDLTASGWERDR